MPPIKKRKPLPYRRGVGIALIDDRGRVFVGSDTGLVYAIDAQSGCYHWAFAADASVRTGIAIGASDFTAGGALIYFGDIRGTVYAVDARSGVLAWRERVDTHNLARITGTPVLAGGRLYVPVSGVGEEAQAKNPNYECCTFRGSVVALDADAGTVIWKAFSIAEAPRKVGTRANGLDEYAPADRKSTRLNSSHTDISRMPSSA